MCDVKAFTSTETQAGTMTSKSVSNILIDSSMAIALFVFKIKTWNVTGATVYCWGLWQTGSSICANGC